MLLSFAQAATPRSYLVQGISDADLKKIESQLPDLTSSRPKIATFDMAIRILMMNDDYSSVQLEQTSDGEFRLVGVSQKRLKEVKFYGNHRFDDDELLGAMNIKVGAQLSSTQLLTAGDRLKEFYGLHGYFNTIVSFDSADEEQNEVTLMVRIRERTPCLIKDIEINTPNEDLKSRLSKRIKKYIDRNFADENVQEIETIITEYLQDNRFINTKLTQNEARYNNSKTAVVLSYQLQDPYSYEVIVHGNKYYGVPEIIRSIRFEDITLGGAEPLQAINKMVRDHYTNSGYHFARVNVEEKIIQKTFIRQVHLYITEGERVRTTSLSVVGRISKPAKQYIQFIENNSSDAVDNGYYVRTDIDLGLKNLIVDLNNQGYLKAKVQSTRVEFDEKQTKAQVTIALDEGPLTILSRVNFYGVKSFAETQLLQLMEVHSGSPLHLNDLERSIEDLKNFYYNHGFIEMRLTNEDDSLIEYDEKGLRASLHFRIVEGPQVFVKAVRIEGNTFTKSYVIYREAAIDTGDLVTPEMLDEARKRLDKLAIFSRVELHTLEANSDVSQRTLIISVVERNPGVFKFGAGLTNKRDLTARGFTLLSYNNLWGTARAVSVRATIENNLVRDHFLEYEVTAGYLEPFLFNKRLRGRSLYTRSEKIFEESEGNKLLATDRVNFIIERDITSQIKFSWLFWGYDSVEKFNMPTSGPLDRESRQEIAYIGPTLDIDFTDNLFMPTKGTYTKIDAEYAAPELGSSRDIQFVRTQGRITHHLRILGSTQYVWANSFQTGYEKNLSHHDKSGVPMSFGFFLGGQNTVRGYSGTTGDRIPNDVEHPLDTHNNQLIVPGESSYYLIKSEVRYPLWKEPFGGVLFYDAGQVNIQDHFDDYRNPHRGVNLWKQSVGVGLRINTPVGPISLDYARKVSPIAEKESPDQWHLSIGTF